MTNLIELAGRAFLTKSVKLGMIALSWEDGLTLLPNWGKCDESSE